MSIAAALVLYAVIWFVCLFIVLPMKIRTQLESGKVIPGTPPSSPVDPRLRSKIRLVTIIALAVWIPVAAVIASGWISIEMLDFFGRWGDGQYG